MNALEILKILDWALALLDVGSTAFMKIQESRVRVQAIRDEGRDPTPEEVNELFDIARAHHESIQGS